MESLQKTEFRGNKGIGIHNHDTIGMVVIDQYGNITAGTTTNGLSYKIPGLVCLYINFGALHLTFWQKGLYFSPEPEYFFHRKQKADFFFFFRHEKICIFFQILPKISL